MNNLTVPAYNRHTFYSKNIPQLTFYCHNCNSVCGGPELLAAPLALKDLYRDRYLQLHYLYMGGELDEWQTEVLQWLNNHLQHQVVLTTEDESTFSLDTDFSSPEILAEQNLGLRQTSDHGKKISMLRRKIVELNEEISEQKIKISELEKEKGSVDSIKEALNNANSNYMQLHKDYSDISTSYNNLQAAFDGLQSEHSELAESHEKMLSEYEAHLKKHSNGK